MGEEGATQTTRPTIASTTASTTPQNVDPTHCYFTITPKLVRGRQIAKFPKLFFQLGFSRVKVPLNNKSIVGLNPNKDAFFPRPKFSFLLFEGKCLGFQFGF